MTGSRDLGGQRQGYLVGIVATEKTVYAYEAWGPLKEFEQNQPAIETSIRSLDVRRF